MKLCRKCDESKPIEKFPHKKSGIYPYCTECNRKDARTYYAANRKEVGAREKIARQAGKRDRTAYLKDWEKRNPEKLKVIKRRWRLNNPEAERALTESRRARRVQAGGTYSAADVKNLFRLQKGCCAICYSSIQSGYHADHITPLAAGGDNTKYNIQLLCPKCNMHKGAKDPIAYAQRSGRLL